MNKAAFLLFVATLAPTASAATFRFGSHLAFVVRGGADEVHSEVTGIATEESVEILDMDMKENQTNQLEGACGDSGVDKPEGCVDDACSVRGGSDVPESIDPDNDNVPPACDHVHGEGREGVLNQDPSAVRGGADVPETIDNDETVEETAENGDGDDGDEGGEGEEGAITDDPAGVRGGADVPEAQEEVDESNGDGAFEGGGEEVLADDPSAVRGGADVPETTDIDEIADEIAENIDGEDGEDGDEGGEAATVDDSTGVRGGSDVPEVTDGIEAAEEVDESKNGEEGDCNGFAEVVADDPSAVRGGADVPETTEIDDVVEETTEDNNDGDGEEGDGATADDATAVRGGADVPEENDPSTITNEDVSDVNESKDEDENGDGANTQDGMAVRGGYDVPESTEGVEENELPLPNGEVADEVAENEDGADDGEGGGDATAEDPSSVRGGADLPESIEGEQPHIDGDAVEVAVDRNVNEEGETHVSSVRGGAQNAADSKESLDEAEYDYEDDELDDDFYEDEDELSAADGDEMIDVSEIDDDVEARLDDTADADGFQVEEPVTLYETVAHQHAMDDDSSAFVDREELADAYDDDETCMGATSFRAGHTDDSDRASIDDVPRTEESAGMHDYDPAQSEPGLDGNSDELSFEHEGENSVDAVISKEVKQILVKECGFRKSELRGMKPQIANVVAEKRLRRPQEGIPDSWYDEKRKGLLLATLTKVLAVAIPIGLGALAIFGGEHVLKLLERRGKNELLIGVEVEKPRKPEGELTIPGTEGEEESFEDDSLEIPTPRSEGNWLKSKISAIENSMKRKEKQ